MKIAEPKWSPYSKELDQAAVDNPQVGDYWSEHFSPYFLVVKVKGDDITVLSCVGGPQSSNRKDELNARVDNGDNTWSMNYANHMVVNREWIRKLVSYSSIPGFCADVQRCGAISVLVQEWREFHKARLAAELAEFIESGNID